MLKRVNSSSTQIAVECVRLSSSEVGKRDSDKNQKGPTDVKQLSRDVNRRSAVDRHDVNFGRSFWKVNCET